MLEVVESFLLCTLITMMNVFLLLNLGFFDGSNTISLTKYCIFSLVGYFVGSCVVFLLKQ